MSSSKNWGIKSNIWHFEFYITWYYTEGLLIKDNNLFFAKEITEHIHKYKNISNNKFNKLYQLNLLFDIEDFQNLNNKTFFYDKILEELQRLNISDFGRVFLSNSVCNPNNFMLYKMIFCEVNL